MTLLPTMVLAEQPMSEDEITKFAVGSSVSVGKVGTATYGADGQFDYVSNNGDTSHGR
jgi:hypothetical protein